MNLIKYLIPISLFFFPVKLYAQSVNLTGIIEDAHTKEPVSYASVYFVKSGMGKTSDSSGKFSFNLGKALHDTLVISYVGYETIKEPINIQEGEKMITILMQRGGLNNGVIVKAKVNKGLFLWKKIMSKKKQYNRYSLPNFAYEAYNKLEVDFKNFNLQKLKKNFLLKQFAFIFNNIDSTSENQP